MKKKYTLVLVLILTLSFTSYLMAEEATTWTEKKVVEYSGGSKTITILWSNLNNKKIVVEAAITTSGLGTVDSLANIVSAQTNSDGTAIAGINGTYFDAYDDFDVSGSIVEEGVVRHIMNSGSAISFKGDNEVSVDRLNIAINGGINRLWTWPNTWYATSINHFFETETSIMIFDKEYGVPIPEHDFTGVLVNKNIVTEIALGLKTIPDEGYLILLKDEEMLSRFHLGDELAYKVTYTDRTTDKLIDGYEETQTTIGAGPTLVKDGKIVVDPAAEGFSAEKITTIKATRSICGVDANNHLAMFVVSSVTMSEAAEIAYNIGLVNAINLDGGASSGIYHKGSYVNTPGRLISNALVIRELNQEAINIVINEKPIYFDSLPYLNSTYSRNLVPLRKIAESLEATVSWEKETSSILITRFDVELKLQANSKTVYVNGLAKEMDIPVTVRNNRSYVPVRFITEYFGGSVKWLGNTNTVSITIANNLDKVNEAEALVKSKSYQEAIDIYLSVYEEDKTRIDVIKLVAELYRLELKDSENAKKYYKMILDQDPDDAYALKKYGWILFDDKDYANAIIVMNNLIKADPEDPNSYYALGLMYDNWRYDDHEKAVEYFKICLTKNPQDYMADYINSIIN